MSEMVRRVAEALMMASSWPDEDNPYVMARAAIAAMRDPTDEMHFSGEWADGNATTVVWEAMIDAALADTDATAVSSAPDAVAEDDSTLPTLDDVRGILRGYGPPSEPVTRAEFDVLSQRVAKLEGKP